MSCDPPPRLTEAADVLRSLLNHHQPNVRFRAAVKVIDSGRNLGELAEVSRQLDELKDHLANLDGGDVRRGPSFGNGEAQTPESLPQIP